MSWQGIEGHDALVEQFRRALARGRLASSFLFVGPEGVGKKLFAVKLAQALLCQTNPDEALEPCGTCPSCAQVRAGSHPDLLQVGKPEDKAALPVELLIGDQDHRMRVGLCHDIGLKPFMGGRRIAIIDDADYLNPEGANCLLKTLEEPPPRSVLILIGTSPARQLPTIRSRCQLIRFSPLPDEVVARLLLERALVDDPETAYRAAEYARGSVARAVSMGDRGLWDFRRRLLDQLARPTMERPDLEKEIAAICEQAGSRAADRRGRLHEVVRFATEYYRQLLHAACGAAIGGDQMLREAVETQLRHSLPTQETLQARMESCLEIEENIDRNANQATLINAWLSRLTQNPARPAAPHRPGP